jgi:hypothetical protein
MANYRMRDARFTVIYVRETPEGVEPKRFTKVPYELVRYNVDANPTATPVVVPDSERISTKKSKTDEKVYENVWIVDVVPFHVGRGGKHDFGKMGDEGEAGEA